MEEKFNNKILFYVSLLFVAYFSFLFLNAYIIKSDATFIGVFQELLTIPMLIAELLLFAFSIKRSLEQGFSLKSYSFWTVFIFFVLVMVTWGSFIM